jgi:hypothetical protein
MDPSFIGAYGMLAGGYELKGQWPEAIAAFEHVKDFNKGWYLAGVTYAWASRILVAFTRSQWYRLSVEIQFSLPELKQRVTGRAIKSRNYGEIAVKTHKGLLSDRICEICPSNGFNCRIDRSTGVLIDYFATLPILLDVINGWISQWLKFFAGR